jgi:eukaryotic-like serine/threonine-protein kinase
MVSASRYEPVTLIGRGAASEVWLGVLEGAAGFRKPVVLKRACVGVNEDLAEAQRALVAEAHLAAVLSHSNIVHVYELVDLPEGVMLAMEHLSGMSVRALVTGLQATGGTVPWPIAVRIVADAARGLAYAHAARSPAGQPLEVVHRDVSPDNIVVTEEGITKVVDFGIARSALVDVTTGLVVKGNLGYLSPEQARGEPLDWRSDVFSLGVVLHELFTGDPLFERPLPGATVEAVLSAPVAPVGEPVSVVARDALRRMLVRDRRSRRVTMGELADTLESVAAAEGGSHRDVATFLRAEFGDRLAQRRARLAELLERPTVLAGPADVELTLTSTVSILELALETPLDRDQAADDTVVDGGVESTLIERPLLGRGGRRAR